jgi:hypothetical protein
VSGGLLVLGMHRSGTSATAGALAAAGFHMGSRLIEGAEDNPQGYFEHAGVVAVHEALLDALDRAWDDVRALPADWEQGEAAREARGRLQALLAEDLSPRAPWAMKDPRLCRLLPLWAPLLSAGPTAAAALLVLRHPDEVAASLARRDRMPAEVAYLLWLRHVLEAEAGTRPWPRACVDYEAMLADARKTLSQALETCGVQAPRPLARAARHVTSGARHEAARSGQDSPWRRLALTVHEAATGRGDPFAAIADAAGQFDELLQRHAGWIATTGAVQAAARGATTRWRERALAAEGRAERLQAGLDEAGALSLSRLAELQAVDERLARTASALREAEQLVQKQTAEGRNLSEALARMEAAKHDAEQLVATRTREARDAIRRAQRAEAAMERAEQLLRAAVQAREADEAARRMAERLLDEARAEVSALTAQVRQADEARAEAERLLDEARAEVSALTAQVRQADEARAEAERLLEQARAEVSTLTAQVRQADEARAEAERLLDEARAEVSALTAQVRQADEARAEAERLLEQLRAQVQAGDRARARIEAMLVDARAHAAALDRRVAEEAAARASVEELALERLRDLGRMDTALRETAAAQAQAERLAYSRQAALEALEAGLAALAARLGALQGVAGADPGSEETAHMLSDVQDAAGEARLRQLMRVTGSVEAAMGQARDALALALVRTRQLEEELQALRASAWWRLGRPFRALRGWLRRR